MRYFCSICKKTIILKEFLYSKENFGKALCRLHQKTAKSTKPAKPVKPVKPVKQPVKRAKVMYAGKAEKTKATPEARKLYYELKERGVPAQLEKWDGHKTIDIAIPEAKINIEVDGAHHKYSHKQALADLWRTFYSFKKGYVTIRIPNRLIKEKLEETADAITKLLNTSLAQLEKEA